MGIMILNQFGAGSQDHFAGLAVTKIIIYANTDTVFIDRPFTGVAGNTLI